MYYTAINILIALIVIFNSCRSFLHCASKRPIILNILMKEDMNLARTATEWIGTYSYLTVTTNMITTYMYIDLAIIITNL